MATYRAKKSFRYAGRDLAVGDEFEAEGRTARTLVVIGRAEESAHDEHTEDATGEGLPAKRSYKTRRLKAEG